MQERNLVPVEQLRLEYKKIDKWAVIVGISEYQYRPWKLNYAHRDAEEIYKLIRTENGGNFKEKNIYKLINENATKRNIEIALHDFLQKPDKDDLVLLYFACHGAPNPNRPNKNLYLLTYDTAPDKIAATGLKMREIDDALKDTLIAEKVIILADTCHSGGIGGGIGKRSISDNSELVNRYLQSLSTAKGGIALLTSAEAREVAREGKDWGGGHGVFTHFVLEGMRGAADRNSDGIVTTGELFEYVRDKVKQATDYRQHPSIGSNGFDRDLPIAIARIEISEPILEPAEADNREKKQRDYQNKLQRYQQEFSRAIEAEYPLSDFIQQKLKDFQQQLGLKVSDIDKVEQTLTTAKEQELQQRQREQKEYKSKLQRYQQEFSRVIEAEYPLSNFFQQRLKHFQQQLGLSDPDLEKITKPLIDAKEKERLEQKQREQEKYEQQQKSSQSEQNFSAIKIEKFLFEVITFNKRGAENSRTIKEAEFFRENLGNDIILEMVRIPSGKFVMGSPKDEGYDFEKPQHTVTVKSFWMAKYQVTQAQWRAVANLPQVNRDLNPNPSHFKGDERPVERVSWKDAVEFCARLSQYKGRQYRLPSEAEWEYACRAVISDQLSVLSKELKVEEWNEKYHQPFHFGETISTRLANYTGVKGEYRGQTTPVGYLGVPNNFGLSDMHGNVWEWCEDDWHDNYESAPTNGSAWLSGMSSKKVIRGGSWSLNSSYCRSACRGYGSRVSRLDSLGFRATCIVLKAT